MNRHDVMLRRTVVRSVIPCSILPTDPRETVSKRWFHSAGDPLGKNNYIAPAQSYD